MTVLGRGRQSARRRRTASFRKPPTVQLVLRISSSISTTFPCSCSRSNTLRSSIAVAMSKLAKGWQLPSNLDYLSPVLAYFSTNSLLRFSLALVPRYLRKNYGVKNPKPLHATSYLDALRGVAAVFVMNHHHLPFRWTWLMELPFFNVLYAGRAMVDVFFVISGYVLSYRMLKLMRGREYDRLFDTLVSASFRRYLRLYASATAAAFIGMIFRRLGWDWPVSVILRAETFWGEVWRWIVDCKNFADPFANLQGWWGPGTHGSGYGMTLWTLPLEFRGSLVLYLFCLASSKLSTRNRMLLCCLLIFCCYCWAAVYPAEFLGGLLIADLSLSRDSKNVSYTPLPQQNFTDVESVSLEDLPPAQNTHSRPSREMLQRTSTDVESVSLEDLPPTQDSQPLLSTTMLQPMPETHPAPAPTSRKQSVPSRIFFCLVFVLSLFLLSQPDLDIEHSYQPWPFLNKLVPPSFRTEEPSGTWEHFWLSIASLLLVWSLDSYSALQVPLRWGFTQYLGNISFGIYIIHPLILASLWQLALDKWRTAWLGDATWTYAPFMVIWWIVVLWASDWFTRLDNILVAWGKDLQDMLFIKG